MNPHQQDSACGCNDDRGPTASSALRPGSGRASGTAPPPGGSAECSSGNSPGELTLDQEKMGRAGLCEC
ncbi:hypothetical protein MHYP_G00265350 [Metynnis hypsauchen]